MIHVPLVNACSSLSFSGKEDIERLGCLELEPTVDESHGALMEEMNSWVVLLGLTSGVVSKLQSKTFGKQLNLVCDWPKQTNDFVLELTLVGSLKQALVCCQSCWDELWVGNR